MKEKIVKIEEWIEKNGKKEELLFQIVSWLILIFSFVVLILFIDKKIECFVNDDMSGELTLGYLLSQGSNPILTKAYLYTTEIRVLNPDQIYGLVFRFCSDWHAVRVISSVIIYVLILASYYFFCKQAGVKKYFAISAAIYLLPTSCEYADRILFPMYYSFHFITVFLTLGLIIKYVKTNKKYLLLVLAIFSFLIGLNGVRTLIMVDVPIIISAIAVYFVNKSVEQKQYYVSFVKASLITFVSSVIGIVINLKVLEPVYGVMDKTIEISELNWTNLADTIQGYLVLLGYSTGSITGSAIISNLFCVIATMLIAFSIFSYFRRKQNNSIRATIVITYFICAFIVFEALYFLTNMEYAPRYCVPFFIMCIPSVLIIFNENRKMPEVRKDILCLLIILIALFIAKDKYFSYLYLDNTSEYREIAGYLVENNYLEGYMGTNCALTEFSNGAIEVYGWRKGDFDNQTDIDILDLHNQTAAVLEKKPEGKIFVLMDKTNYDNWTFNDVITLDYLIYETSNNYVFGFDSYSTFKSLSLESNQL